MGENKLKRQKGIAIANLIFNVIAGFIGFGLIEFADLSLWLDYVVMAVLWIGLFVGLFLGIHLIDADTRKTIGVIAVIINGIMLLLFAVDNVSLLGKVVSNWNRSGSAVTTTIVSDFPAKKPSSNLNQGDIQSDTVIWINAIYAIPTYADSRDYRFIGGTRTDMASWGLETMLESGWGVTDRKSALECVEKLIGKGHQSSYMEYMEKLDAQGLLDLDEEDVQEYLEGKSLLDKDLKRYMAAYRIYKNDAENGIIAWDYCRAVQLLGYYYVMDYITLEECMAASMEIAKMLQQTFDSWEEMAESYLLGYEFWSGQSAEEYGTDAYIRRAEYNNIMRCEPYIFAMDWNYELQDTWSGVEHSVDEDDVDDVVCDAYTDYVERMGYEMNEDPWLRSPEEEDLSEDEYEDEWEEDTEEDENDAAEETGSPSEEFVKEKTAQLDGDMETVIVAGVPMKIGMQFKEVMDQLEYTREFEDEKLGTYEVLNVADGKAKDSIMISLYTNEGDPKDLGEMYIGSISVFQPLSDDMEKVLSHSVLANGIHIGSTRKEVIDAFEKSGLTLVQDKEELYQYTCDMGGWEYLIFLDNYDRPQDDDIVTCISAETNTWD